MFKNGGNCTFSLSHHIISNNFNYCCIVNFNHYLPMSSNNHPKKRKKTSSSSSRKSRGYVCMGCNFTFASKEKLLHHKQNSTCISCTSDLHICQTCQKSFLTANGLSMHENKNESCGHSKLLPDIVNTILFCKSPINDPTLEECNSVNSNSVCGHQLLSDESFNDVDNNPQTTHDSIIPVDDIHMEVLQNRSKALHLLPLTSKWSLINPDMTLRVLKKAPSSSINTTIIQFKQLCDDENKHMSLNIEELLNTQSLPHCDHMIAQCYRHTQFNSPTFYGTMIQAIRQFWNSCYLVPEIISSSPVLEEDIISFLHLYSSFEQDEEGNDLDIPVDDEMLDLTHNNDSNDGNGHHKLEPRDSNVATDMIRMQESILEAQSNAIFDNSDIAKMKLYDMLNEANCPKYLFEDIQKWAAQYSSDLSISSVTKRNTFVNNLGKKVYGDSVFQKNEISDS